MRYYEREKPGAVRSWSGIRARLPFGGFVLCRLVQSREPTSAAALEKLNDRIRPRQPAPSSRTIGRTPASCVRSPAPRLAGVRRTLAVKLELLIRPGRTNDRMALAMIEGAERSGALRARHARRGIHAAASTGSSLALVCAMKGYRVPSALVGRVRQGEARHDARVRRRPRDRAERRRQGDAGAVRSLSRRAIADADARTRTRSGPISSTTPTRSTATPNIGRELCSSKVGHVDAFVGARRDRAAC